MRIPLFLAGILLSALPARALDVGTSSPEAFIARSRREPKRLYALMIGAIWCHPCKLLAGSLAAAEASSATAVGRAAWDRVEVDEYGSAKFSELMAELQAPEAQDFPSVLVIRDGDALGMSLSGNNLPKIEAFLAEAERQPARYDRKPARSSMLCPGKRDWATYTLGISGYKGAGDGSTDDFGRKVLLSFVPEKRSAPGRLFAPPRSKSVPGTENARSSEGVFFTAADPLAERATLLEDVARSSSALAALAKAPGRDLRLILTGHSSEEAMTIGYRTAAWFNDDPANTYEEGIQVTPRDVADAVRRATHAGKRVRGLVTTCFAGRYGGAFMPQEGVAAAPACAAFATLPDKSADGCYTNGLALGFDYASKLLALKSCSSPQDGRSLHYAAAVSTSGHDIPMLSSEYFLLYGPGAAFLGRGERAPAPPLSVQRYDLPSDVRVYVDVISNQVLRAYQGAERIAAPRLALLDCVADDYTHEKLDRQTPSAFYLRPHKTGDLVGQCTPFVSLYWEDPARPSTSVYLEPAYGGWDPAHDWSGFRKDFGTTGPVITMQGMRPAARVLLASVIPAFSDAGAAADLGERLDRIAAELRPYDAPLSGALKAMMTLQAGGVERLRPAKETAAKEDIPVDSIVGPELHHVLSPTPLPGGKAAVTKTKGAKDEDKPLANVLDPAPPQLSPELSTAAIAGFAESRLAAGLGASLSSHAPPPAVDAPSLIAAMFNNIAPAKDDYDPSLPRLAHLAAAAQAELALIEEAKTSPEARRLFSQLESIKACEKGLY